MNYREEIFSHEEHLWVLCVPRPEPGQRLSSKIDLIDWYNNQLLANSIIRGRVSLDAKTPTLLSSSTTLPTKGILIYGLGDAKSLDRSEAQKMTQDLGRVLDGLNVDSTWVLISSDVPESFADEFQKSRTSSSSLSRANISIR